MKSQEIIDLFDRYVIANYTRLPIAIAEGSGSHIRDAEGNVIVLDQAEREARMAETRAQIEQLCTEQ